MCYATINSKTVQNNYKLHNSYSLLLNCNINNNAVMMGIKEQAILPFKKLILYVLNFLVHILYTIFYNIY